MNLSSPWTAPPVLRRFWIANCSAMKRALSRAPHLRKQAMVKEYQANSLPPLQNRSYACLFAGPEAIPDNNASGLAKTVEVSEDLTIENLRVKVCVDHPDTSQTGIEITSPLGTKSILLNIRNGVKEGLNNEAGVVFGSNAFYGEKAKGTWTLRVLDSLPEKTGTLKRFDLRILGY